MATGSAVVTRARCEVCGEVADLRYDGPIHGRDADVLCLPCIANGVAADRLGEGDSRAEFTLTTDVGVPAEVPVAVLDEIHFRTPGYHAWQEPRWLYHCGDYAGYLFRCLHCGIHLAGSDAG